MKIDYMFTGLIVLLVIVFGINLLNAPKNTQHIDIRQIEETSLIECSAIKGDMSFRVGEKEYIRICENGTFYVNNREVTKDTEIYDSFKEWIKHRRGDILCQK